MTASNVQKSFIPYLLVCHYVTNKTLTVSLHFFLIGSLLQSSFLIVLYSSKYLNIFNRKCCQLCYLGFDYHLTLSCNDVVKLCTRQLGRSKIKTDSDIKEVIRLYVFPRLTFILLTTNPYLHCGRWRTIVYPPSGSFVTTLMYVFLQE